MTTPLTTKKRNKGRVIANNAATPPFFMIIHYYFLIPEKPRKPYASEAILFWDIVVSTLPFYTRIRVIPAIEISILHQELVHHVPATYIPLTPHF